MALSSSSYTSLFHLKKHSPTSPSPSNIHLTTTLKPPNSSSRVSISSSYTPNKTPQNPIIRKLQIAAGAVILTAATSAMIGKFSQLPARAESPSPALTEETPLEQKNSDQESSLPSPLSKFLESNSETVDALKSLLQGEDEEALKVLERLTVTDWKFLMARLLNEMGDTENALEMLKRNPSSFEALFENALLMDRCGEGHAVITRLGEVLRIAEDDGNKEKEARDVKLIMAQIQFLHKNVDDALRSYEELEKEDPSDFRPYFCKGLIYSWMDQNVEAREQFAKYRELLLPNKFGTNDGN